MTSIALPARARESVEVHQSLVAGGRRTTSVLVSPRVPHGDTSLAVAWLGESQRLVRAIGATARFAVYRDDLALILVLDAPPPLTRRVLDSLRDNKPGEAPDWDAAVEDGRGPEGFLVTRPSGY